MKVLFFLQMCWRDTISLTISLLYIIGYSVTVMGQTDQDRVFHIRAMGVSTNSTERVGSFYFRSWSPRVPLFRPRAYLGDAAAAYANAAMLVFASISIRLMCFAHVYKVSSSKIYLVYLSFTFKDLTSILSYAILIIFCFR